MSGEEYEGRNEHAQDEYQDQRSGAKAAKDLNSVEGNNTRSETQSAAGDDSKSRRDFLSLLGTSLVAIPIVATGCAALNYMSPAQDQLAMASTEADISGLQSGSTATIKWRGKPVFIRKRTQEEIEIVRAVPMSDLRDPQTDDSRVLKGHEETLIVVGVCTHLGCVPISGEGEFGGWFCPCHGSHYDASGRIRKGPAPTNLVVPAYKFKEDGKTVIIGEA